MGGCHALPPDGSETMIADQIFGVFGQGCEGGFPCVELRLEREDVLELAASMFADIVERQVTGIHAMDYALTRNAENCRCLCRSDSLVLGPGHCLIAKMAKRDLFMGCLVQDANTPHIIGGFE